MNFSINGFVYQVLIDPILLRLYNTILDNIDPSQRVVDVACGTGSQAMAIARKAIHVTGIDLSEEMISTARRAAHKRGVINVQFELRDASNLSAYENNEFDIAITSMAVHQFESSLAITILSEMKRIASKVIIVDYNYPMPKGFSRLVVKSIERFAGGDHYRNFRKYMGKDGIHYFAEQAGVEITSEVIRGNGVFVVVVGY